MHHFDEEKQLRFNIMFFSLKVIALFFCITPLIQHFFSGNTSTTMININVSLLMLFIMLIITFMWLLISRKQHFTILGNYIEMFLFYVINVLSVYFSGKSESYYKYLFIFMIVIYTVEFGIKTGGAIAAISCVTVFLFDFLFYNQPGVNPYFQSDITLSAMFMVVTVSLGFYVKLENKHIDDLVSLANIDGLTGCYNHRYFYETLTDLFNHDPEGKEPLSAIMIDIDYFKTYNDLFGHPQGDEVLRKISKIITEYCTQKYPVYRYGGEEFAVIFQGKTEDETVEIAEQIRKAIAHHQFDGAELMPQKKMTVSIGVSCKNGEDDSPVDLINRIDSALYRAKFLKKNRVERYMSFFKDFSSPYECNDKSITSIRSLLTIINSRDNYTYNHTERVVEYCKYYAEYTKMSHSEKTLLLYGAYLHDVGKVNISKDILMAKRSLSKEEFEEIKQHPIHSANIIKPLHELNNVIPIVLQHHEHFDGSGYPNGLKGNQINDLARILSIADSFDAMTAKRPYQQTKTFDQAFDELIQCSGTQFDPELVKLFIEAIKVQCNESSMVWNE